MMALSTDLMIGAAPPERAGAAAAIASATPQLGGAFGIAVLGSIITASYRMTIGGSAPDGIPDNAAAQLEENLNTASTAAKQLPEPLATQFLDVARDAFTTGFQVAAAVSIVIVVAASAVIILLGRPRASQKAEPSDSSRQSQG